MHKKRIKGKSYFYTSYRNQNGQVKTKYLGNNEKIAKKSFAFMTSLIGYLVLVIMLIWAYRLFAL